MNPESVALSIPTAPPAPTEVEFVFSTPTPFHAFGIQNETGEDVTSIRVRSALAPPSSDFSMNLLRWGGFVPDGYVWSSQILGLPAGYYDVDVTTRSGHHFSDTFPYFAGTSDAWVVGIEP